MDAIFTEGAYGIAALFFIVGLLAAVVFLCAMKLNRDADRAGWNPPGIKPFPGEYQVRLPVKSVEWIYTAVWDGQLWRDADSGFQCYFQEPEWRPIPGRETTLNQVREMEGWPQVDGGDDYLVDPEHVQQVRAHFRKLHMP